MIRVLLHHGWLSLRRAHYFGRSMGIKLLMFFAGLIFIWYLYMVGMMLPGVLQSVFPWKPPHEAFFSLLVYIYIADLAMRLLVQKVPRQLVRAYLPLPVSRKTLASYILIRSWFSLFNFYLFALLVPLFIRTLLLPFSATAFWSALLGCFLMGGVNHALVMWIKTWPSGKIVTIAAAILIATAGVLGGVVYPGQFMDFSASIGDGFIASDPVVFMLPLMAIAMLQWISKKGLLISFYDWGGAFSSTGPAGSTRLEKRFAKVPVHGPFWELEWKLITRNRRTSAGVRQWPLVIIGVPAILYFAPGESIAQYMVMMVMIAGGYGFYHLQYSFSWESRFFDMIASRNIDVYTFILSKYYFYCLLGLLQVIPMLALLALARPEMVFPMAGMYFYVTGPVFAFLLNTGVGNSTRIDPNKKASFNLEGTSGTLFLTIFATMFSIIFLMTIAYFLPLPIETGMSLLTGLTGLVFIMLHRQWIQATAAKFNRKKYHNLNKYREKQ